MDEQIAECEEAVFKNLINKIIARIKICPKCKLDTGQQLMKNYLNKSKNPSNII